MGDCRIRILISKELVANNSNDDTNQWQPLLNQVFSSDTTVREVCDASPQLINLLQQKETSDACLWDCTKHPPKDITDWPLDKYTQIQGLQSLTLWDAGWFPSGSLKVSPRSQGIPISAQSEDAQYNLSESVEKGSAQSVQLVGGGSTKMAPSQVLHSVTQRFGDEMNENESALQERRTNAQAKKRTEQERFRKLEARIQKLEANDKKKKSNKPVSDQVRKMLLKSRATGKSSLKAQDRVYFHIIIIDAGDEAEGSKEEFRYFSIQDTVGKGILGQFTTPKSGQQAELLVKQQQSTEGEDAVYRRLPNAMRVYEAIEKKFLEPEANKVVIRWYSPDKEEPTTDVVEGSVESNQQVEDVEMKDSSTGQDATTEAAPTATATAAAAVSTEDATMEEARAPTADDGDGTTLVDASLAALIQRKDEEEQKKSKKKSSKTSAKVKQMLIKSKAKGDAKRLKKMEDRFFFELVVINKDSTCEGISPCFLGRKDPLGRVTRDCCAKAAEGEVELLVPMDGGENKFQRLVDTTMTLQAAETAKLLQPFDRLVVRFLG